MFQKVVRFTVVAALLVSVVGLTGCSKAKKVPVAGGSGVDLSKSFTFSQVADDLKAKQKAISSYTMVMDADGRTFTQSVKMKDGKPVRMKMDMGGQGIMLMMLDQKVHYMYNPATKTAMKMEMKGDSSAMGSVDKTKMPKELKLDELKDYTVSSETIDGVDCWKIESELQGQKTKNWVDKEYGLPRQETIGDKVIKMSYTNINSVPDSEFELAAGTKVQDMSAMMKGMPNMRMPNMPAGH